MKRAGNLFDKVISIDNLRLADDKARRGKKNIKEIKEHDLHREEDLQALHDMLAAGQYHTSKYHTFLVHEPKERVISKLPYYPDRIVHHAILNILEPIWVGKMTADTYACIKHRGIHKCAENIRHILHIDHAGTRYCLKIDIRKYYPSIDHDIMMRMVERTIKDERLIGLIDEIVRSAEGLPIGNYLSQYLANIYLLTFDHWVKEVLHVRYYFRYVDDMVFLANTKEELRHILESVRTYLCGLRLQVKDNWQVFPVDARGIDYLGYVFFHDYTLLRKGMKKRIFKLCYKYKAGRMSIKRLMTSMASYKGWLDYCDSNNLRQKINRYTNESLLSIRA